MLLTKEYLTKLECSKQLIRWWCQNDLEVLDSDDTDRIIGDCRGLMKELKQKIARGVVIKETHAELYPDGVLDENGHLSTLVNSAGKTVHYKYDKYGNQLWTDEDHWGFDDQQTTIYNEQGQEIGVKACRTFQKRKYNDNGDLVHFKSIDIDANYSTKITDGSYDIHWVYNEEGLPIKEQRIVGEGTRLECITSWCVMDYDERGNMTLCDVNDEDRIRIKTVINEEALTVTENGKLVLTINLKGTSK